MFGLFQVKILMVNNFNREIEQNVVTNCNIYVFILQNVQRKLTFIYYVL